MTQQLRAQLEQIAADAPDVAVADDTWRRGRDAHRRDLVVRWGAVAAALALIGTALGLGLNAPSKVDPADSLLNRPVVLPASVEPVPQHLISLDQDSTYRWAHGVGESDLGVGPATLAFVAGDNLAGGLVVVVTRDGAVHPLALPDFAGAQSGALSLSGGNLVALSPDGTHLAWVSGGPASGRLDERPVKMLITVTDLTTGDSQQTDLRRFLTTGQAIVPDQLTWSPDGRQLAWRGQEYRQYNASGIGSGGLGRLGGRFDLRTGRNERVPAASRDDLLGVLDDSTVLLRGRDGGLAGRGPSRIGHLDPIEEADQPAYVSPDGTRLAVGHQLSNGPSIRIVDLATGRATARPLSGLVYAARPLARPVGWADDTHLVVAVTTEGDPNYGTGSHLAVMTVPPTPAQEWGYRILTRFEGMGTSGVSVAPAGLDLAHPTEAFPAPDWPWSTQRLLLTWGLGALGFLLLLVLAWRLRRP